MGWHMHVYRREVEHRFLSIPGTDERYIYLEDAEGLPQFTEEQLALIRKHLERREYRETGRPGFFRHAQEAGVEAILTGSGLFFTAPGSGIMEISMTASEFATDYYMKGQFTTHDPQNQS